MRLWLQCGGHKSATKFVLFLFTAASTGHQVLRHLGSRDVNQPINLLPSPRDVKSKSQSQDLVTNDSPCRFDSPACAWSETSRSRRVAEQAEVLSHCLMGDPTVPSYRPQVSSSKPNIGTRFWLSDLLSRCFAELIPIKFSGL